MVTYNSEVLKDNANWKTRSISFSGVTNTTITVGSTSTTKNVDWEIQSISVDLSSTGSTVAGNRQLAVEFQTSTGGVLAESRPRALVAVSQLRRFILYPDAKDSTAFIDTDFLTAPIPKIRLVENQKIKLHEKSSVSTADSFSGFVTILEKKQSTW